MNSTITKQDVELFKQLNEVAARQAEQRISTPIVNVKGKTPIIQKQEIARISKATGGQMAPKGFYHYFADENDARKEAYKGSQVVLDEATGDVVRVNTDIMFKIPTEIYQRQLDDVGRVNPERVQKSIDAQKRNITSHNDRTEMRTVRNSAVK